MTGILMRKGKFGHHRDSLPGEDTDGREPHGDGWRDSTSVKAMKRLGLPEAEKGKEISSQRFWKEHVPANNLILNF